MAVERRSALTKATTPDDPLAGMGAEATEEVVAPAPAAKASRARKSRAQQAEAPSVPPAGPVEPASAAVTRQVGRPRTRQLQVTFSSKVDLDVRARLDAWKYETGEKIVELLDRALREAMGMPAGGVQGSAGA